ncbi:MAG: X-Pro aminopeptidase, partial [Epsilonproteobacteria bacterium]|nr:X-Pro aminopeptidase [Campylobacterota bacterium]
MNYILKDENAQYFECGFSCDNAIFLKLGSEAFFITDARYTTEATQAIQNAEVVLGDRRDLLKTVRLLVRKSGISRLVYNPSEWSVDAYERLSSTLNVHFQRKVNFSQEKRIVKSEAELTLLKQAARYG